MGKFKTIARAVAGWIAIVLSLFAVFVFFNTWLMVPNDTLSGPSPDLLKLKAEISAGSLVVLTALILFTKWAFKKPNSFRDPD
jgi:hypothetical protein